MRGMAVSMIQNGISTLTGHLQIHSRGYRNDPAIENRITAPEVIENALEKVLPKTAKWTFRVRVNAVASNARHSSGVTLLGIDPTREALVSFIGTSISSGHYLQKDDYRGIIIGEALLDKFNTKIGHKLVIMSQDADHEIASRAFRIVGTFQAEMEGTEKQYVFVTRQAAQKMLKLGESISEVSVLLAEASQHETIAENLKATLPADQYEVNTWSEILPFVKAYLQLFDGFVYIWYLVVFIAMSFGIVNTTLMAVFERIREFGLLKALGMKPWWIIRGVLTESFIMLMMGMIAANALAFLSIWALSDGIDLSAFAKGVEFAGMTRIIYPVLTLRDWLNGNLIVLLLGLAVCIYPAAKAARFRPVEALAHT